MGRYDKNKLSNLLDVGTFILSGYFKIAPKLDAKRMHLLIKLNGVKGVERPRYYTPPRLLQEAGESTKCSGRKFQRRHQIAETGCTMRPI
jgi:hypothetical protein